MYKNVASQKAAIYAWDAASSAAKTGDAANITAEISKDGGASAATNDANPTELDATDHPGIYIFDLTQAETNADMVIITPVSATADILIHPLVFYPTLLTSTKAGYIDAPLSTIDTVVDGIATAVAALNDLSTSDILAMVWEGTLTFQDFLQRSGAVLFGTSTGGGTAEVIFYDPSTGAVERVTATVNAAGNRSAITFS